jgi:hypothetical protein
MSLKGYDEWKTTPPEPVEEPEDPDCTCYGSMHRRDRRNCPVHGEDPDAARDAWIDRQTFG